eukprot:TRINITY_DN8769_c0_g1_i2.p1 TRINITY_DN8769_c0_g1~~TRINITY_DN8769_c0_g1_i2.p1  ORF type:complete len:565 (+),score=96.74 TRINITY_DN8769_c0_g1_i2:238-1932(+)
MRSSIFFSLLFLLGVSSHSINHKLNNFRTQLEATTFLPDSTETVVLTAFPKILEGERGWVNVSIQGMKNPSIMDILALYSPSNANPKKNAPVKFLSADHFVGDYLKNGNAVARFDLTNFHSDVSFVLFRNGTKKWPDKEDTKLFPKLKMVAKSNSVFFKNPRIPNQAHIAFTSKPGEMRIMWATDSAPSVQFLKIGRNSNQYDSTLVPRRGEYSPKDLCGSPAKDWGWKHPGLLYDVVVKGLEAGARYYYIIGGNQTGWSEERHFTAASINVPSRPVNFVSFGDLGKWAEDGTEEHWNNGFQALSTVEHITAKRDNIDFVLNIGDLAYAVGYSPQWDEFMNQIQPVAAYVPWMTTPGNHETDYPNSGSYYKGKDSGGECGVPYEKRFLMPIEQSTHWYSFNYGPVHIIAFSTEHNFTVGSKQYKWMVKDLASVDRKVTPWLVVAGHRPMYAVGYHPGSLLTDIEPLFDRYNVNVALWGHVHNYERTCPMSKGECKNKKTTHVVIGMGGYGFGLFNETAPRPSYLLKIINIRGYSQISADLKTFEFKFFNQTNLLADSFKLFNQK